MSGTAPAQRIELEIEPTDAVRLALYAAASGDHNPLHLDPEAARAAGFERPIVHGMLTMAYAARLLTTHFGTGALRSLSVRFTGVVLQRERLAISGTLDAHDDSSATYRLRALNPNAEEVLTGTAVVSIAAPGR